MVTLATIQGQTLAADVGPQLRGIGDFIDLQSCAQSIMLNCIKISIFVLTALHAYATSDFQRFLEIEKNYIFHVLMTKKI